MVSSAQPTSGSSRRSRNLRSDGDEVAGQDQAPQEDRALEGRPQRGDVVEGRRAAAAVLGDVLHGEVAGDERPLHRHDGEHGAEQHQQPVGGGLRRQLRLAADDAGQPRPRDAAERGQEAEQRPRPSRARAFTAARCPRYPPRRRPGAGPRSRPRTPRCASPGCGRWRRRRPSQCPSSTTGMPGWNSSGGSPWWTTPAVTPLNATWKLTPSAVSSDRALDHRPLDAEAVGPQVVAAPRRPRRRCGRRARRRRAP